jgi:hypothetical protein
VEALIPTEPVIAITTACAMTVKKASSSRYLGVLAVKSGVRSAPDLAQGSARLAQRVIQRTQGSVRLMTCSTSFSTRRGLILSTRQ